MLHRIVEAVIVLRDPFVTPPLASVVESGVAPLVSAGRLMHLPEFDVLHIANARGVRKPNFLRVTRLFAVTSNDLVFLEGRLIPAAIHSLLRTIVARMLWLVCLPGVVALRIAVIKALVSVAGKVVLPRPRSLAGVAEASLHGDGPKYTESRLFPFRRRGG